MGGKTKTDLHWKVDLAIRINLYDLIIHLKFCKGKKKLIILNIYKPCFKIIMSKNLKNQHMQNLIKILIGWELINHQDF